MAALDDKAFRNEFQNVPRLKHQNIVQLLGYCNESKKITVERDDRTKFLAEKLHKALCFEYIDNGSLHKYILDENQGLEWPVRFKIIKGICEGVKHLRVGLEKPLWHLDLKPDNILLDQEMTPKIADFGIARLIIGDEKTRKTMSPVGTCGYWPPEFVRFQFLSDAFDIFSLGVIIAKIMIGTEGYNECATMEPRKLVKHVHNNWKKRLQEIVKPRKLEVYCRQVKACIAIASECLAEDRRERPRIQDIVDTLNSTEIMIPMQIDQEPKGADEASISSCRKDSSKRPYEVLRNLPLTLLEKITDNFSNERELGRGKRGVVYKGVYEDGQVIAVKVFEDPHEFKDKDFHTIVRELAKVRHENIVQSFGFTLGAKNEFIEFEGKHIFAIKKYQVLYFEYLQKGSLDRYISDESCELDWCTCYKLIKGTCRGVRYLHEALPSPIILLNLNPSNILLDENMVPKIGDIVMSRLLTTTANISTLNSIFKTHEYIAPEFIKKQVITSKSDIYSLGIIIIEILTRSTIGRPFFPIRGTGTFPEYVKHAAENWRKRLEAVPNLKDPSMEGYCQQVKKCIEMALRCVEEDMHKRPTIGEVVCMLDEAENLIPDEDDPQFLDVHPTELRFLFQMKKHISCLLRLHNKGVECVSFLLESKSLKRYLTKLPLWGFVPPRCTYTLALTIGKQPQRSPSDNNEGFLLRSIAMSHDLRLRLKDLDQASFIKEYDSLFREVNGANSDKVHEVTLKSICAPLPEGSCSKPTRQQIEIIATQNAQKVLSIDVHTKEPWIMTTHQGGNIRVWNYHKMEILDSFEITDEVYMAKFIVRDEWIVAGGDDGHIYVYSYDESQDATSFEAHNGRIMSLAAHPTDRYVVSSSHDDRLIKLWHWNEHWDFDKVIWECTRTFKGHSDKISQFIFNPEDSSSFASASWDGTVKIWGFNSDVCNTLKFDKDWDGLICVNYFTAANRQHIITGSKDGTAQVWDLETKRCTDELQGHADHISVVYYHSELQKLITGSLDGTIRIWCSTTYRLENIIALNLGAAYDFQYIEELQRLVVGCYQGLALVDINSMTCYLQVNEGST